MPIAHPRCAPLCRTVAAVALTLCLASAFSGCRQRAGADAADGRVHVTWMVTIDFLNDMYKALVRDFEAAHPGIKVDVQWAPANQYRIKFKTLAAAGLTPDLFYCGDVWVAYLRPFLRDITEFVRRDADEIDLDDFYPELREACRYKGRYYYLPRWFNISLLYYNRTLFDEAGLAVPSLEWTWAEYLAAAKALTRKRPDGSRQWGSTIVLGWWGEWLTLVRQSGGEMFSRDLVHCLLDRPEAVSAMQFYHDKIYKHGIAPRPGYGPANGFASGAMAMEWGGHTGLWVAYNRIEGLDWDIEVLPRGPKTRRGGEVAVDAFGIAKTCPHPEAAWQLLKFMTSKEGIRRHARAGFLPPRRSIAEEVFADPKRTAHPRNWRAAYKALEYAQPIPQSPDYIELALDIIQPEMDLMAAGKQGPAEACRAAAAATNAFIRTVGAQGVRP